MTTAPRGVTTPTRTLDDFGPISNLAGLSDKEHTVFCSAMWAKANNRLVNFAALGRQLGCSGQWCGKLFQRARVKLYLVLGHEVDLPPYDGLERYADFVSIPVGGMEWFVSYFDGEESDDQDDHDDHGLDEGTQDAPHWMTVLSDGDAGDEMSATEGESFDDLYM